MVGRWPGVIFQNLWQCLHPNDRRIELLWSDSLERSLTFGMVRLRSDFGGFVDVGSKCSHFVAFSKHKMLYTEMNMLWARIHQRFLLRMSIFFDLFPGIFSEIWRVASDVWSYWDDQHIFIPNVGCAKYQSPPVTRKFHIDHRQLLSMLIVGICFLLGSMCLTLLQGTNSSTTK